MKTTIQIYGKDVEITLTKEQVAQINKQKQLDPKTCTLQEVIDYLGEDDQEVLDLRVLQQVRVSDRILANQEAVCFNRALNEKFEFDWNDTNQEKWRIWWYMDNFHFNNSNWNNTYANVPTSLCFKSKKLSDSVGNNETYKNICKRFMY